MGFAAFQVVAVGVMHGVMTAFMGDDPAATGNGAGGQAIEPPEGSGRDWSRPCGC
jgi:hypothetical protein